MARLLALTSWLSRTLSGFRSLQAWEEAAGMLLLLAGGGSLVLWSGQLSLQQQVIFWSALVVALAALWRRAWIALFGPVLFYELLRTARRTRYIFIRWTFAVVLAGVLFWLYAMWYADIARHGRVGVQDLARLAEYFFFLFMAIQFVVVIALTPAYTAGAIADEKERKTLEFLLATDLDSREIVLGKLVARLSNLIMLILVGLPILSLMQFFGGIDPNFLLVSYAALVLTMASLACLGILSSVLLRRARDAIVLTYLATAAYVTVSAGCRWVFLFPTAANFRLTWGPLDVTLGDLVDLFGAGNLPVAIFQLGRAWDRGRGLPDILPEMLRNYAAFHIAACLACASWACLRMRAVALKQSYGKSQRPGLWLRIFGRPRVGGRPMLWKECLVEPGFRFGWLGRLCILVLVVASLIPPGIIIYQYYEALNNPRLSRFSGNWTPARRLAEEMNVYVRLVGAGICTLSLLAVTVRAASSVSGERDKQTLDGLLTTPLDSSAILFAKWLGSILSVWPAWLWFGFIWLIGLCTDGLHPVAVPLLPVVWLVYAAGAASIGIWYSIVSRTTLRASMWSLLTTLGFGGGHWLLMGMCCYIPLAALANIRGRELEHLAKMEAGQTVPFVLAWFAFHQQDFEHHRGSDAIELTIYSFFGLGCWAVGAWFIWTAAATRFRQITGRHQFWLAGRLNYLPGPSAGMTPERAHWDKY
jgi:ABC-type transport system involved in multi-copper enzyme maturation permease subunit